MIETIITKVLILFFYATIALDWIIQSFKLLYFKIFGISYVKLNSKYTPIYVRRH